MTPHRLALGALLLTGCGGPSIPGDELLARLRAAIPAPVNSPEESRANSRLVEDALDADVFHGMTRDQVRAAVGAGDPCSRHAQCRENGFEDDDWYYTVGAMGEGPRGLWPVFVLGFDTVGKVSRTWNLRVE